MKYLQKLYWILPLLIAVCFRFTGSDWDDFHLLHPDERFLVQVTEAGSLPESFSEWIDPAASRLNPANNGFQFFVYGTLPLLINKAAASLFAFQTTPSMVVQIGRFLSALFDVLTVACIGFASWILWKNKKSVLLSMGGYAILTAAIQQSHFYTFDTVVAFLVTISILSALLLLRESDPRIFLIKSALTGFLSGCAAASKINAVFFLLLPFFIFLAHFILSNRNKELRRLIVLCGLLCFAVFFAFTFRIFQPYAFREPNLLNFSINADWLNGMKELSLQSRGFVAFPPAWQWVDQPVNFALKNLFLYGSGIALSLILISGWIFSMIFIRKSYVALRGKKAESSDEAYSLHYKDPTFPKETALMESVSGCDADLASRTVFLVISMLCAFFFFIWQMMEFSKMMRYFLPIFPLLFMISGGIFSISSKSAKIERIKNFLVIILFLTSLFWSLAFLSIYHEKHTRIQASEWIYANIPSPLQAVIETTEGSVRQSIGIPTFQTISFDKEPVLLPIQAENGMDIQMAEFQSIIKTGGSNCSLMADICTDAKCNNVVDSAALVTDSSLSGVASNSGSTFYFPVPVKLNLQNQFAFLRLSGFGTDCSYRISSQYDIYQIYEQKPSYRFYHGLSSQIRNGEPLEIYFESEADGNLYELFLSGLRELTGLTSSLDLAVEIINYDHYQVSEAVFRMNSTQNPFEESESVITFRQSPVLVQRGDTIGIKIFNRDPDSVAALTVKSIASESKWDDILPLPATGRLPYDMTSGYYGTSIDLDLFADENILQREKMLAKIDAADYWVISSNRIYGAAARIHEKYPLLERLYRQLINCPESEILSECFEQLSKTDLRSGNFFQIAAVFESEPHLFGHTINTQTAEEAFTVYDHPKVFILQKADTFDLTAFRKNLDAINLSQISNKNPVEYRDMENILSLLLTDEQAAIQQTGGTWSVLFNRSAWINENQIFGTFVWMLILMLIGWIFFPMSRIVFGSLRDKGFGISKFFGILCIGYVVWICGFLEIPYTRGLIIIVIAVFALLNLILFLSDRKKLSAEIHKNIQIFLRSELIFLSFFLFFLLIRLGNPDLWHPAKGGEKPMDFSYFNAVLKSTIFPPYDPWFAGGYLNYYYYGFFLSGLLVKLIGMIPSIAYNLILPTWYGFLAIGAYSAGSAIYSATKPHAADFKADKWANISGMLSIFMLQVIGNLGTIKIILSEMVELGSGGATGSGLQNITWFFSGLLKLLQGQHFQMYRGDWYWIPSRAIPGEPITEFPFFTFLYGDPHAHLFALPITVLVLVWLLAIIRRMQDSSKGNIAATGFILLSGSLIIGSLIPANTWDMPTYLLISCVVLTAVGIKFPLFKLAEEHSNQKQRRNKTLSLIFVLVLLCGAVFILFTPYLRTNFRDSSIDIWNGNRTPLWSYWMHWGFFLFALISWYSIETIQWMACVKLSNFRKFLREKKSLLVFLTLLFLFVLIFFSIKKVVVVWTALPLMGWSALLLFRRNNSPGKRFLMFLTGTGVFITLFVEMTCLRGDLGRMNMVFKLYLQAWVLLSISAAVALTVCLEKYFMAGGHLRVKHIWRGLLAFFVIGTLSFTISGSIDKMTDRMSSVAPHSLDGMDFMKTSTYYQDGFSMDLSQDYLAIRWLQDHVEGSPVIVEANATEYKWGNRYTIYTGLPGVVGWNYHQRQQRGANSDQVWERVKAIEAFYNTISIDETIAFLKKYNVSYIVVGQMEEGMYTYEGLYKFERYDRILWDEVYQNGDTFLYQVRK